MLSASDRVNVLITQRLLYSEQFKDAQKIVFNASMTGEHPESINARAA